MIDFRTQGMDEFRRTWRRYQSVSRREFPDMVKHRVGQWGWSLFVEMQRVGRKAMRKIRRMSPYEMRVRSRTRTPRQEKAVRIFAAGYTATGWVPSILKFGRRRSVRTLADVKNPEGSVAVDFKFGRARATLVNSTPGAYEADRKHKVTERSLRREQRDMTRYIERKESQRIRKVWR